jgi:hypothetical protein
MSAMLARMAIPAVLMVVLWLLAATVKARAVKDELGFTQVFVAAVKQRWPGARVDVHSPPLHLQVEVQRSRQPDQVSLSDAYVQYRSEPGRLADLMEEHLHSLDQAREIAHGHTPPPA